MKAIAAMSNNRVIGKDGRLPWGKNKEDMKFFREKTIGNLLVMGHTTFKNVGILPDRWTFVLTRNTTIPRQIVDHDLNPIVQYGTLEELKPMISDNTWVCGGASIYKQLLPQCSELFLTILLEDYEGDTYMPDFDHLFPNQEVIVEKKNLWIVRYSR